MAIGQAIPGRLTIPCVPGAALSRDLDEAQRHCFADRGSNRVTFDPELDEMVICARQPAILFWFPAVAIKFDLQAIQNPSPRQA
jgi:hypothetical protein